MCAISICHISRVRTAASGLTGQLLALQELQEELRRKSWRAVEAEAKAVKEASELQAQLAAAQASNMREASQLQSKLAAAQASNESAQQEVKRLEQDVERLEQQLAGSQAAAAPKEQQLAVTQVQSDNVFTCLSCTSLAL